MSKVENKKKPLVKATNKKVVSKQSSRDARIEKRTLKAQKWLPTLAIGLFSLLFVASAYQLMKHSKEDIDHIIVQDVENLQKIFMKIHEDCSIVSFEHDCNYIDFLTVEKFVGSEVGAMNVLHPGSWKGPYLKDNLTMQQQQYVIAKTASGYYIVPGNGVKLSNGKVMGSDIVIDASTDMANLLINSDDLYSKAGILVAEIPVGTSKFTQGVFAAGTKMHDVGF